MILVKVQCETQGDDVRINDSEEVEIDVDTAGDYMDEEVEVEEVKIS